MTAPEYVGKAYPPVHNEPARSAQWEAMSEDQVRALRKRLIESIIQVVVQAVTGLFTPGGEIGDALEQLTEWSEHIVDNIPLLDDVIEILSGVEDGDLNDLGTWVTSLVNDPIALLTGVHDLIVGLLQGQLPGEEGFPYTFPFNMSSAALGSPLIVFVERLLNFFGLDWLDDAFDAAQGIVDFIINKLLPTNLIAQLIDGILPDFQAPQIVADIINNIEAAFEEIPLVGNILDPVFDAIRGLLGIGRGAQGSANVANSQVTAIWATILSPAGGVTIVDDFSRSSANNLGATLWQQTYSGPGSGTLGLDGDGNTEWDTDGGNPRACLCRNLTVLNTDTQAVSVVLVDEMEFADHAEMYVKLQLRMNAARTHWVEARMWRDWTNTIPSRLKLNVAIGHVVGGVYTQLGSMIEDVPTADGDLWEFRAGTAVDDRQFVLIRNGFEVMSRTDSADTSALGASYRYGAFTVQAGVTQTLFVFFNQVPPPRIAVAAISDREVA